MTKSKLFAIRIQPDLLESFTQYAKSCGTPTGTMIKKVVSEAIAQKQKNQAA